MTPAALALPPAAGPAPTLPALREIAVFRALQLGDLLCAVPALRALRQAAPQARITLIGLAWAREFARRFECYIDDFMLFPGYPGMPETTPVLGALPGFLAAAQARRFDLAIQMHGSGILSNPLVAALGAATSAGFFLPGQFCPDPGRFLEWQEHEHEVTRFLRLLEHLGIEPAEGALEFPLRDADYRSLRSAVPNLPAPGSYVCIHPGARLSSRRWPPERFARVARDLARRGWRVVLTGSTDERVLIDAVLQQLPAGLDPAPLDLCGRTGLGALAVLVGGARLVVCNDTGVSHIAAALATPSVVICNGADPQRWAPLDRMRHRVLAAEVPCRPCAHADCPIGHPCADGIGSDQVLAEALRLLAAVTPPLPARRGAIAADAGRTAPTARGAAQCDAGGAP